MMILLGVFGTACRAAAETLVTPTDNPVALTQAPNEINPTLTVTSTSGVPAPSAAATQTPSVIILRFPAIRQQCRLVASGAFYQGEAILETTTDCWVNEQQNDTLWGIATDDSGAVIPVTLLDTPETVYDEALTGVLPAGSVILIAYGNSSGAFAVDGFRDYSNYPVQYGLLGLSYQGRSLLVIITIAVEPPLPAATP